jgi:hypothetical protein
MLTPSRHPPRIQTPASRWAPLTCLPAPVTRSAPGTTTAWTCFTGRRTRGGTQTQPPTHAGELVLLAPLITPASGSVALLATATVTEGRLAWRMVVEGRTTMKLRSFRVETSMMTLTSRQLLLTLSLSRLGCHPVRSMWLSRTHLRDTAPAPRHAQPPGLAQAV